MKVEKEKKISRLKKYQAVIKNGMFLFGLRNRLANLGIDVNPYYWVEEEHTKCPVPTIKDDASQYVLKNLTFNEIKLITEHYGSHQGEVLEGIKKGQLCLGLENNGEIACYTFIELKDFVFNGRSFKLKPNEAYLLNMWTFHKYRGKNLAPYLRYQAYRMLEQRGINAKYSISQYFNKSWL